MTIAIKTIDADFERALQQMSLSLNWKQLKKRARELAAERLLRSNMVLQDTLIEQMRALAPLKDAKDVSEYLRLQNTITRVFDEHTRLMDIAFPRQSGEPIDVD